MKSLLIIFFCTLINMGNAADFGRIGYDYEFRDMSLKSKLEHCEKDEIKGLRCYLYFGGFAEGFNLRSGYMKFLPKLQKLNKKNCPPLESVILCVALTTGYVEGFKTRLSFNDRNQNDELKYFHSTLDIRENLTTKFYDDLIPLLKLFSNVDLPQNDIIALVLIDLYGSKF